MRVLVTGATGFVGGAVVRRLREAGYEVTGTGRRPGPTLGHGAQYASWNLHDPAPVDDAGRRVDPARFDAVVHCAAVVDDRVPLPAAMRGNADAAVAARRAFAHARFVHVSTSSVYDCTVPHRRIPESAGPAARLQGTYAVSKAAGERALRAAFPDDPGIAVIRPHAVYGPGDTTLLPRLESAVRRGVLRLPGDGRAPHALTHVDTLCDLVETVLERRAAGVYNVSDAAPVRLVEALPELLGRRGGRVRVRSVPVPAALAVAGVVELAGCAARRPAGPLTRFAVRQLALERTYDLAAARATGWIPRATSFEGAEGW